MEASTSADQESTSNTLTIENIVLVKESLDLSSPWRFSDVVLVVGDTKLHVHKCILSMWSPVFKAMFSSQFVESSAKEIPLPGKLADEVEVLLKFIYSSGTKPTVTEENYKFLLQLADEYQMDRVKSMCSEFLVDKIQVTDCLGFFKLAEQFHLDDVTEKCYEEVRYNSSADLEGSEHFNGFDPEFKLDICMRVIKELERTLEEYVTTCTDLAQKVYKKVYEDFYSGIKGVKTTVPQTTSFGGMFSRRLYHEIANPDNLQQYTDNKEHIQKHKQLQIVLQESIAEADLGRGSNSIDAKDYNIKYFEFSCSNCIKRVQGIEWNNSDSYSILKEPVNKLYALQKNNKVAARIARKIMANQ